MVKYYLLDHLSSPAPLLLQEGLALLPFLFLCPGCQPPDPPSVFGGFSFLSNFCPWRSELARSLEGRRRCIKLQNPPRLHSPFSFCRQQASRKSVTGESSAYNGRPWDQVNKHRQRNQKKKRKKEKRPTCVPTFIQVINGGLRLRLPLISSVHVSYKMVSYIVTDMKLKQMTEFCQFTFKGVSMLVDPWCITAYQ